MREPGPSGESITSDRVRQLRSADGDGFGEGAGGERQIVQRRGMVKTDQRDDEPREHDPVHRPEDGPERDLHAAFARVLQQIQGVGYQKALETIAGLRPQVDLFFDKVLVNAHDPRVRQNRLAFLASLLTE